MIHNPFEMLPEAVEIGGRPVRIDPDFRVGVAIETEMLSACPDVPGLLSAFYPDGVPEDIGVAADRMIWFYAHTDSEDAPKAGGAGKARRLYDFRQDADALLASFWQAYSIDLDRVRMHWWKFRRLMFGLPADTPFMQRVHYRTADLSKLGREEKKRYRKLQDMYAVRAAHGPKYQTVEDRDEAMKERVRRRVLEAQHAEN